MEKKAWSNVDLAALTLVILGILMILLEYLTRKETVTSGLMAILMQDPAITIGTALIAIWLIFHRSRSRLSSCLCYFLALVAFIVSSVPLMYVWILVTIGNFKYTPVFNTLLIMFLPYLKVLTVTCVCSLVVLVSEMIKSPAQFNPMTDK
jgi:hypothetical protein